MTPTPFYINNLKIHNQREAFGKEFLAEIIDWLGYTFEPDDIYNQEQLRTWFKTNFDFTEITTDQEIKEYARKHFDPDDIFSKQELEEWADDNGYSIPE
jgi:hypothetical protein